MGANAARPMGAPASPTKGQSASASLSSRKQAAGVMASGGSSASPRRTATGADALKSPRRTVTIAAATTSIAPPTTSKHSDANTSTPKAVLGAEFVPFIHYPLSDVMDVWERFERVQQRRLLGWSIPYRLYRKLLQPLIGADASKSLWPCVAERRSGLYITSYDLTATARKAVPTSTPMTDSALIGPGAAAAATAAGASSPPRAQLVIALPDGSLNVDHAHMKTQETPAAPDATDLLSPTNPLASPLSSPGKSHLRVDPNETCDARLLITAMILCCNARATEKVGALARVFSNLVVPRAAADEDPYRRGGVAHYNDGKRADDDDGLPLLYGADPQLALAPSEVSVLLRDVMTAFCLCCGLGDAAPMLSRHHRPLLEAAFREATSRHPGSTALSSVHAHSSTHTGAPATLSVRAFTEWCVTTPDVVHVLCWTGTAGAANTGPGAGFATTDADAIRTKCALTVAALAQHNTPQRHFLRSSLHAAASAPASSAAGAAAAVAAVAAVDHGAMNHGPATARAGAGGVSPFATRRSLAIQSSARKRQVGAAAAAAVAAATGSDPLNTSNGGGMPSGSQTERTSSARPARPDMKTKTTVALNTDHTFKFSMKNTRREVRELKALFDYIDGDRTGYVPSAAFIQMSGGPGGAAAARPSTAANAAALASAVAAATSSVAGGGAHSHSHNPHQPRVSVVFGAATTASGHPNKPARFSRPHSGRVPPGGAGTTATVTINSHVSVPGAISLPPPAPYVRLDLPPRSPDPAAAMASPTLHGGSLELSPAAQAAAAAHHGIPLSPGMVGALHNPASLALGDRSSAPSPALLMPVPPSAGGGVLLGTAMTTRHGFMSPTPRGSNGGGSNHGGGGLQSANPLGSPMQRSMGGPSAATQSLADSLTAALAQVRLSQIAAQQPAPVLFSERPHAFASMSSLPLPGGAIGPAPGAMAGQPLAASPIAAPILLRPTPPQPLLVPPGLPASAVVLSSSNGAHHQPAAAAAQHLAGALTGAAVHPHHHRPASAHLHPQPPLSALNKGATAAEIALMTPPPRVSARVASKGNDPSADAGPAAPQHRFAFPPAAPTLVTPPAANALYMSATNASSAFAPTPEQQQALAFALPLLAQHHITLHSPSSNATGRMSPPPARDGIDPLDQGYSTRNSNVSGSARSRANAADRAPARHARAVQQHFVASSHGTTLSSAAAQYAKQHALNAGGVEGSGESARPTSLLSAANASKLPQSIKLMLARRRALALRQQKQKEKAAAAAAAAAVADQKNPDAVAAAAAAAAAAEVDGGADAAERDRRDAHERAAIARERLFRRVCEAVRQHVQVLQAHAQAAATTHHRRAASGLGLSDATTASFLSGRSESRSGQRPGSSHSRSGDGTGGGGRRALSRMRAPIPTAAELLPERLTFPELLVDILYRDVVSSHELERLQQWIQPPITRDSVRALQRVFDRVDARGGFAGRVRLGDVLDALAATVHKPWVDAFEQYRVQPDRGSLVDFAQLMDHLLNRAHADKFKKKLAKWTAPSKLLTHEQQSELKELFETFVYSARHDRRSHPESLTNTLLRFATVHNGRRTYHPLPSSLPQHTQHHTPQQSQLYGSGPNSPTLTGWGALTGGAGGGAGAAVAHTMPGTAVTVPAGDDAHSAGSGFGGGRGSPMPPSNFTAAATATTPAPAVFGAGGEDLLHVPRLIEFLEKRYAMAPAEIKELLRDSGLRANDYVNLHEFTLFFRDLWDCFVNYFPN